MSDIGIIGMGVMGLNLSLNIVDNGECVVSVYNRTYSKTEEAMSRAEKEGFGSDKFKGFKDITSFISSLKTPKKIIILVKAGDPVDKTIEMLLNHLNEKDIIIDGGNEWFLNTERRIKLVNSKKVLYLGMGVSGGEKGARYGPSMMPGGNLEAYKQVEKILIDISAKVKDNIPCVTYIGSGGSGNYVKMVHNGIEYGDMQLICEIYDLMKTIGGLNNKQISDIFEKWNKEELKSYLIEITYKIFRKKDGENKGDLIDMIMDKSGSKGTGKWTVQSAADVMMPVPTISAALFARYISSLKDERVKASDKLQGPKVSITKDQEKFVNDLKNALYCSKICSYAQGMSLLKQTSKDYNWGLKLNKIAEIWRGGCIIRATFLDRIAKAYLDDENLDNLLMDSGFCKEINDRQSSWREIIGKAVSNGVPVPSLMGSLSYYDSYRRKRLPANLVQAQRDFFGSHKYRRIDDKGKDFGKSYHTEWE